MSTDCLPSVSVVVATYQRGTRIAATLGELLDNVDPAEVVVVDDGSTDETAEILLRLAQDHPRIRALSQPNAGGWLALLAGARVARGEIVLLLDDDVMPVPGVVAGHAAHHAGEPALVVLGYMPVPTATSTRRSWPRDIYARSYEQHCREWEACPGTVLESLWAGHLSIRRADLLKLADRIADAPMGYHRDLDVGVCAAEAGLRGRFDRRLVSDHRFERSSEGFAANALSSGESLAEIHVRHGAAPGGRPSIIRPLPPVLAALARRARGAAASEALLWAAISGLGALRLFALQRYAARQLWRFLQAQSFAQRQQELRGDPASPSAEAARA